MKPTDRTIVFLAHALERGMSEVLNLKRELAEAMTVNKAYQEKIRIYERENQRLRHAAKLMIATGTGSDLRSELQAVFDAAMETK